MSKSIPEEIKEQVLEIVESYNEREKTNFQMTFKGKFAYLSKIEEDDVSNIFMKILSEKMGASLGNTNKKKRIKETKLGRLEYSGKIDDWEFAVFKYSRENYDANESFFPGSSKLNGPIEGALNAGKEIYP
jgi:hypothetical protein